MGKQGEEFDSVESKKLAELFIRNLEKLVKYQTAEKVSIPGWTYDSCATCNRHPISHY
jgi:hypothetical protein